LALAGAVRAADARGDEAAAEQWLAQLGSRDPVLHAVLKAERLLAHGRPVDAINALDVAEAQPLPPRGLLLRARALAAVHRAGEAEGLPAALRQQGALPPDGLAALEIELAAASLEETDDANLLAERWEAMPKPLRTEPAVIGAYARRASALGWHDAAMRHLEQALDVHWDEELVDLYARLPVGHVDSRRASPTRRAAGGKARPRPRPPGRAGMGPSARGAAALGGHDAAMRPPGQAWAVHWAEELVAL